MKSAYTSQPRSYMSQEKKTLNSYISQAKNIEKRLGYRPNKFHLMYKMQITMKCAEDILKEF